MSALEGACWTSVPQPELIGRPEWSWCVNMWTKTSAPTRTRHPHQAWNGGGDHQGSEAPVSKRPRFPSCLLLHSLRPKAREHLGDKWRNSQAGWLWPGQNLQLPAGTYICGCYILVPWTPEVLFTAYICKTCGRGEHWRYLRIDVSSKASHLWNLWSWPVRQIFDLTGLPPEDDRPLEVSLPVEPFPPEGLEPP